MNWFTVSHSVRVISPMVTGNPSSSGFVQHLKLPHYVDFQSELALVRGLRKASAGMEESHDR